MSKNKHPNGSALDRRTLLRAGLATAFAGPAGAIGAQAFTPRVIGPAIDVSEFPICKTSSNAPPLTGAPRKLKLSWNAGAVCLAPLPVAIDHGFFQKLLMSNSSTIRARPISCWKRSRPARLTQG